MFKLLKNTMRSSLFIGASLALATSMSNAAAAFDLMYKGSGFPPTNEKFFEWQGLVGSPSTWEFGIGRDATDKSEYPTSTLNYVWQDGGTLNWSLVYDKLEGEAIFSIITPNGTETLAYTNTLAAAQDEPLTRIGYELKITGEDDKVEPVTSYAVNITEINGESINVTPDVDLDPSDAINASTDGLLKLNDNNSTIELSKFFETVNGSDEINEINSIKGTLVMDWDTLISPQEKAANARIQIGFKGYGPEDWNPPDPEDTPEPSAVLGLLALGGLGFLSRSKKNNG